MYCSCCGLVYTREVIESEEDASKIYVESYEGLSYGGFLAETAVRLERNEYRKRWLDRQLKGLGREFHPGSALEIGARDGSFLWLLKEDGWQVLGIDPNQTYSAGARQHYGVEIKDGYFRGEVFSDQSFDLVACFQLFEHIEDPAAFLRAVRTVLKNGGIIYLETPNLGYIQKRQLIKIHVILYSRLALCQVLEQNGFRVLAVTETLPGMMTFDQLGVLAKVSDGEEAKDWRAAEDFSIAKAMIERSLQDDFPYAELTLGNHAFRIARSLLGGRLASVLKGTYRGVQSSLQSRKLAKTAPGNDSTAPADSLPEPVRQGFLQGFLNEGHLREITRHSDEFVQLKVLARIKAYRRSVEDTRRLVDKELVSADEAVSL
jgi:2-polyprenyl-3-methyl-5-hydroxy-6-metoxy-1,4-benzoquinol methylase